MSTSADFRTARVLVVGLGGLGCPAALALARAGVGTLVLCDDDVVEASNLHRQILYGASDVGRDKLDAARDALERLGARVELRRTRLLPDTALELVREVDVVVEGADNYATKFLAADACHLAQRPVVHGAGVRWITTAWAVAGAGRPCYRCLFEDVPGGAQAGCNEAGVMAPVVGFGGALMADLALSVLARREPWGQLCSYDGQNDRLRSIEVAPRVTCDLCGQSPVISDLRAARYVAAHCAA